MGNDGNKPPSRFDPPTDVMPPEELEALQHAGRREQTEETVVDEIDPLAATQRSDPAPMDRDDPMATTLRDAPTEVERDLPTDPTGIDPPSAAEPANADDGSLIFSAWPTQDAEPVKETIPPEPTEPDAPSTGDGWDSSSDGWPTAPGRKKHGLWDTDEVAADPGMVTIPPDVMKIAPAKADASSPHHRSIDLDPDAIAGRRMMVGGTVGLVLGITAALVVGILTVGGLLSRTEPSEASDTVPPTEAAIAGAATPVEPTAQEAGAEADEADTDEAAAAEPTANAPTEAEPETEPAEETTGPVWTRFPGTFPPHATRVEVAPAKLDRLLSTLENCSGPIRIFGHASTGAGPTDDEVLALARAEFVKEVLIAAGVAEGRIRAQSARHKTEADDLTEEDDARKRRVVLMCKTGL